MTLSKETSVWAHSLVAAGVSGFATSLSVMLADPTHFNLTAAGILATLKVGIISAIVGVMAVLKQSPLPRQADAPAAPAVVVDKAQTVVVEEPKA